MNAFQLGSIGLCLVLFAGCSDDEPAKTKAPPIIISSDDSSQVELKIPEVSNQTADVQALANDNSDVVAIERADIPVEPDNEMIEPTLNIPRPLLLSNVVRNRFSNLLQGPIGVEILDAVFYPLGWSLDGKFAYAIEPPDEAVGSYFLNVYVQDLVTDKILWQDKYQSAPESTAGIQSFAAYWQTNQTKMEAIFKQYGIQQINDSVLFAGAISNKDDRLDYVVKKKLKGQPDLGNLAVVTEYQVIVTSDKLGSKTVHRETIKNNARILDADVIGYLRGDDTERVALLVAGVRRGWEGPPHTTWFKIVGTNLNRGFKKP